MIIDDIITPIRLLKADFSFRIYESVCDQIGIFEAGSSEKIHQYYAEIEHLRGRFSFVRSDVFPQRKPTEQVAELIFLSTLAKSVVDLGGTLLGILEARRSEARNELELLEHGVFPGEPDGLIGFNT